MVGRKEIAKSGSLAGEDAFMNTERDVTSVEDKCYVAALEPEVLTRGDRLHWLHCELWW